MVLTGQAKKDYQRNWVRQKRAEQGSTIKGSTQGITAKSIIETKREIELRTPLTNKPKRGKDIKCFADLPPDVQTTIDRMSIDKDGTINQTTKANRTAIAINYQHLYPGRYYSTGVG